MAHAPADGDQFARLVDIMARLRAPDGCPWDREQTHTSLTRYLVEETHEVIDAIEEGSDAHLAEELGDLILQVVFQAQLAAERGAFDIQAVCRNICDKLVRRHPHVFGEVEVSGSADVLRNWEAIKREERGNGHAEPPSVLSGVPRSLAPLARAQAVQKKAGSVGFDWDDIRGPLDKLREETEELAHAVATGASEEAAAELGDVLFAAVNIARFLNVDADGALRQTLRKFEERFAYIEQQAASQGRDLEQMPIHEMDELWERAKLRSGGAPPPCDSTSS